MDPTERQFRIQRTAFHRNVNGIKTRVQVKMSLLFHRSTSARNTTVETTADVVTSDGKAKNAAEKELVAKLVNDINDVKSVNNRMTIK